MTTMILRFSKKSCLHCILKDVAMNWLRLQCDDESKEIDIGEAYQAILQVITEIILEVTDSPSEIEQHRKLVLEAFPVVFDLALTDSKSNCSVEQGKPS